MADYTLTRGDDESFSGLATKPDGTGPQNLTGCKLWMTAKRAVYDADADAIFQKSSPSGGISIDAGAAGTFTVSVASADTTRLPSRTTRLLFDVQCKDASGKVFTVLEGSIDVVADITQATT